MKLWNYKEWISGHFMTGILRQTSLTEKDGSFKAIFIRLKINDKIVPIDLIQKDQIFKPDDINNGYAIYPVEEPSEILKELL